MLKHQNTLLSVDGNKLFEFPVTTSDKQPDIIYNQSHLVLYLGIATAISFAAGLGTGVVLVLWKRLKSKLLKQGGLHL